MVLAPAGALASPARGYANGDDALSRALAFCQRYLPPREPAPDGTPTPTCRLYAVDDALVQSTP